MAFGLMVKKWGILQRPLEIKVQNVKRLIITIARLHNFCINERLAAVAAEEQQQERAGGGQRRRGRSAFTPTNVDFDAHETVMRAAAAFVEYDDMVSSFENPWSANRDRMAREIAALHLTRPQSLRSRALLTPWMTML